MNKHVHIRWMIRKDMPEVLAIEQQSYGIPWSNDDFCEVLKHRNCIGMVAESEEGTILGYMIYALNQSYIRLLNIAVDHNIHGFGVGRSLIEKLLSKLSLNKRITCLVDVSEKNLGAQLFFKSVGFRAISVAKGYFDEGHDAYVFCHQLQRPVATNLVVNEG